MRIWVSWCWDKVSCSLWTSTWLDCYRVHSVAISPPASFASFLASRRARDVIAGWMTCTGSPLILLAFCLLFLWLSIVSWKERTILYLSRLAKRLDLSRLFNILEFILCAWCLISGQTALFQNFKMPCALLCFFSRFKISWQVCVRQEMSAAWMY